jgi:hypothetical protein
MHTVVLFLHIVQMFTILINLVVTENSLQQQERVKVFVMPARGVIEDTNT